MSKRQVQDTDIKQKEKLQAVVLADSFTEKFRPITLERPKVRLIYSELFGSKKNINVANGIHSFIHSYIRIYLGSASFIECSHARIHT